MNVAYTLAHSDSNAPDSGNSSLGVVQYNSFDIEMDRGPDPNVVKHRVVANATWDIPVGRNRKHGANMPGWANTLFGGWTVSSIFQARSGNNLTPFFTGFYTTSPWNIGLPLDGVGNCFCELLAPGPGRRSQLGRLARQLLQPGRLRPARARQIRQRQEGQPARPRHLGRQLRVLQGRDRNADASACSSPPCSTTRSTIPSSSWATGTASRTCRRSWSTATPTTGRPGCSGRARSGTWKGSQTEESSGSA